jgi:hypothetical protein
VLGLAPDRYEAGQLRTFERRVEQWRAEHGPDKEVFFPQAHRPGEAGQTDFTEAMSLGSRSPASRSFRPSGWGSRC